MSKKKKWKRFKRFMEDLEIWRNYLANCMRSGIELKFLKENGDFIWTAFNWDETPEGADFWLLVGKIWDRENNK